MKKFLEEFKAFALKGNMMDMAIGGLIGGASLKAPDFVEIINAANQGE